MQYNFEWDPSKAKENLRKHKISFENASEVFLDPFMSSIEDEEHSEEEDRWVTLGRDKKSSLLIVIHTFREIDEDNSNVRLISARKATKSESKQYSMR
ncbi:MAG: BrnT family toxin [Chloroflexi bacterium]|nr:BrnT family toxin [Chloroflexota bacterium]